MNKTEYLKVKDLSYQEYCNYLKEKYGNVPYKYGNRKNHKKGLFIHHIGEYEIPSLSNTQVRKETDPKYQEPEMLCYSDYLEHLLLHIMIGRETNPADSLGLNGPCQYIIPALINYYQDGYQNPRWDNEYYALLDGNRDVFDLLLTEYNDLVKDIDVVLEHNTNLYAQVEHMLDTKNKALVVLGTGCGKTTTALQYIKTHKCRALLIGPNNLIKEGWSNNGDWVDTITYQAFANKYGTINYSQYGLVIIDEAHHAGYDAELGKGAKTWGKAIQYLVDNNIKLLGLTATPDRNDGVMLGETLFSDCVCQGLSVEEAIEQGIVYPFSYITSIYNKQGITEELQQLGCYKGTEDPERIKLQGQLDLALNNIPDATSILKKHMPHNKRKGIIFIQEIADAPLAIDFFKQAFPEAKFKELHSKLSKQEIKEAREWFENTDEGYLVAINMISEGAHYPGVNTVVMFRRTSSYLLYMQQIGRIITITKKENPDAIVFDLVNNINTIKPGDRTRSFNRPNINSELKKVLFKVRNSKSSQIIVEDYCQDFVERLKRLKEYTEYHYLAQEEILIIKDNYEKIGPKGCCELIDKWWLKRFPGSLKEGEHHRTVVSIQTYARRYLNLVYQFSKIYQIDINSYNIINSYDKVSDAKNFLKSNSCGAIFSVLKGKAYSAYGYLWCYQDEYYEGWKPSIEKPSKREQVYCYNNKRIFLSAKQAGEELNLNTGKILRCCKKLLKHTGGYQFCYLKDKDTYVFDDNLQYVGSKDYSEEEIIFLKENIPNKGIKYCAEKLNRTEGSLTQFVYRKLSVRPNLPKGKKVKCVELDKIFDSIKEASEYVCSQNGCGIVSMQCSISKNLKGKNKTAGGYHWKYVE